MNILQLLKDNYKQYKINDSSNRNIDELMKIMNICKLNSNILVYIERNTINLEYFEFIESLELDNGIVGTNINDDIHIVIINKDNYIYIRKSEKNINNVLRTINNNLLSDEYCCICYEEKSDKIRNFICPNCQSPICTNCIYKLNDKICPCCKFTFTYGIGFFT